MLVSKFLMLGYASASYFGSPAAFPTPFASPTNFSTTSAFSNSSTTNGVLKMWANNATTCAGAPTLIHVTPNTTETSCVSMSCACSGEYCYSYNSCSSESISKIGGTAFGNRSYASVSKS